MKIGTHGYFAYKSIKTVVFAPNAAASDGSFVMMSANIRRKDKWFARNKFDIGDHRWYRRARSFLQTIAEIQPDLFGSQEAQPEQFKFLSEHLKGYGSVTGYRDNNGARSESCPIFYNETRFELLSGGIFWLSETPDVMSISWKEGGEHRVATVAELKDKKTGDVIAAINSHPDFEPPATCKKEIEVIAAKAAAMLAKGDKVVVFGDLNADIHTAEGAEILSPLDAVLTNAVAIAGTDYGYTFNGYDLKPHEELDYFFFSEGAEVLTLGKFDKTYNGVFPSDHFPIYTKVRFGKKEKA